MNQAPAIRNRSAEEAADSDRDALVVGGLEGGRLGGTWEQVTEEWGTGATQYPKLEGTPAIKREETEMLRARVVGWKRQGSVALLPLPSSLISFQG